MKNTTILTMISVLILSTGCSSLRIKSEHSSENNKVSEQTDKSLQESKELDEQIKADMSSIGINPENSNEQNSLNKETTPSSILNPLPTDEKNLAFVRFNIACWDLDNTQSITFEEDAQVEAFSDYVIVIKDKNGQDKSLPPLCLMESTEKFTNVPFSKTQLNFECLFGDNVISGEKFSVVQQLSPSLLWLIDPSNGQNFVLTTKLCQLIRINP